jgi:hypothetical protein
MLIAGAGTGLNVLLAQTIRQAIHNHFARNGAGWWQFAPGPHFAFLPPKSLNNRKKCPGGRQPMRFGLLRRDGFGNLFSSQKE